MDKLSLNEAGIWNVVSVPDGAPAQVQPEPGSNSSYRQLEYDPERDVKFSYVWQCRELWSNKTKIVLATDNDGPGRALAEELARRLGRERCWRVKWPSKVEPNAGSVRVDVLPPEGSTKHSPIQVAGVFPASSSTAAAEAGGESVDDGFRKDANEVLMKDGAARLIELIENAEELPVAGLYRFREYYDDILRYFNQVHITDVYGDLPL
jgi:twinkle protein